MRRLRSKRGGIILMYIWKTCADPKLAFILQAFQFSVDLYCKNIYFFLFCYICLISKADKLKWSADNALKPMNSSCLKWWGSPKFVSATWPNKFWGASPFLSGQLALTNFGKPHPVSLNSLVSRHYLQLFQFFCFRKIR